jgi:chromosome segregation ATPase
MNKELKNYLIESIDNYLREKTDNPNRLVWSDKIVEIIDNIFIEDTSTPDLEAENARLREKLEKKKAKISGMKERLNDLIYALDLERSRNETADAEHAELQELREVVKDLRQNMNLLRSADATVLAELEELKKKLTWIPVSVKPEYEGRYLVKPQSRLYTSAHYYCDYGWCVQNKEEITHYFDPSLLTMPEDEE